MGIILKFKASQYFFRISIKFLTVNEYLGKYVKIAKYPALNLYPESGWRGRKKHLKMCRNKNIIILKVNLPESWPEKLLLKIQLAWKYFFFARVQTQLKVNLENDHLIMSSCIIRVSWFLKHFIEIFSSSKQASFNFERKL